MSESASAGTGTKKRMGVFERYLTLWVAACIAIGTLIGNLWPGVGTWLSKFTYAEISLPVAVLIWLMIYPMMLQIDFASIKRVGEKRNGLVVTTVVNWLIKPFTMFGIAWLFFNVIFKDLITLTWRSSTSPAPSSLGQRRALPWSSCGRTCATAILPTRSCRWP
jgi:ACR3 family arsenite efflux pump ArsB